MLHSLNQYTRLPVPIWIARVACNAIRTAKMWMKLILQTVKGPLRTKTQSGLHAWSILCQHTLMVKTWFEDSWCFASCYNSALWLRVNSRQRHSGIINDPKQIKSQNRHQDCRATIWCICLYRLRILNLKGLYQLREHKQMLILISLNTNVFCHTDRCYSISTSLIN